MNASKQVFGVAIPSQTGMPDGAGARWTITGGGGAIFGGDSFPCPAGEHVSLRHTPRCAAEESATFTTEIKQLAIASRLGIPFAS